MLTADPTSWTGLRPGSVINLKDLQTLKELMTEGELMSSGLDLLVKEVHTYDAETGTYYHFETDHETLDIIVKIVDSEATILVVYIPDDFTPGTRAELLEAGCQWLFAPPEDEENFVPSDLEFTDSIVNSYGNEEVEFVALFPTIYITGGRVFKQLREWHCEAGIDNPELIVFETGGVTEDGDSVPDGGWVEFYQGTEVSPGDISLLPV